MTPKTVSPYSPKEIADLKTGDAPAIDNARIAATFETLFERLDDMAEEAADHRSLDLIDGAPGEFLPLEATERLIAGESAVKVWRKHRGMNQGELAAASGISQNYLSEIERGHKGGSVEVLKALARALGFVLDDLA